MRGQRGFRAAAGLLAAVLSLAASACATVPTTGPVVKGDGGDGSTDPYGGYVRMLPAGPQPGVGEEGLVKGFLKDLASFEGNHEAAREFLSAERRSDWSPDGPVLVYDSMDTVSLDTETAADGDAATVHMRSPQVATIDASGQYVPSASGKMIDVTFELARNGDGEWRVSDLPEQLILGRRDVDRAYRPVNLYYFNPDRSTLVPDPVFLPRSTDNYPARLVKMLVEGPTGWLQPAVDSAFPQGTKADVAYDAGFVTVELRGGAIGAEDRFGVQAQIGWTLKQLPEVKGFSLSINGTEVEVAGGEEANLQSGTNPWASVNPSGVTGDLHAYFSRDGQLWSLSANGQGDKQRESRVPGAPGSGGTTLEEHAVSIDENHVAGIEAGGESVVVAKASEGSEYTEVLAGGDYTSLSWDGSGNLWVADDTSGRESAEKEEDAQDVADDTERDDRSTDQGGEPGPTASPSSSDESYGTRLWMLRGGTDPVRVQAPELENALVTQMRVSRDGTRVAALTESRGSEGGRLAVGRVVDSGGDEVALGGFIPLAQEIRNITGVSWRGGDQLAILGEKNRGATRGFLVSVDGSTEATSIGAFPGADMKSVAAAPGEPLLSGAEDDQVWMTNDRVSWQRVTDGAGPVYPG